MNQQKTKGKKPMKLYDAVMIAEEAVEASETKRQEAWQFLISNGAVWNLQGWFGRRACELIANGVCNAPIGTLPARAIELIERLQEQNENVPA
jgi:hypothetical protein